MANMDMFKDVVIKEGDHDNALQEVAEVMKANIMPKGVLYLEKLYVL